MFQFFIKIVNEGEVTDNQHTDPLYFTEEITKQLINEPVILRQWKDIFNIDREPIQLDKILKTYTLPTPSTLPTTSYSFGKLKKTVNSRKSPKKSVRNSRK